MQLSIERLLDLEDNWLDREGLDEGEQRNAWLEEGIRLYKKFIELDQKEPRYAIMLADLYLQLGRDKKMRQGNHHAAYNILRNATIYSPNKPDAFYHLSFVFAKEERKWEAVLFYGKEAIEKGIDGSKRIKLLCNLALGYQRLGYPQQGMELIKEALKLDEKRELFWFIQLYLDRMKKRSTEPILLKENDLKRKTVSLRDLDWIKEEAIEGKCVVLDLTSSDCYFYGHNDSVALEQKQAEMLGYLIDNQRMPCSKRGIEEAVWLSQEVGATTVRRYISAIRAKLAQAMGRDDIADNVLVTANGGYVWKADIPAKVLRKG